MDCFSFFLLLFQALFLVIKETKKHFLYGQEENKILEKMHRQKIAEVEKLCTTVAELEEAILAGGATANAIRESRQHVNLLMVRILFLAGSCMV